MNPDFEVVSTINDDYQCLVVIKDRSLVDRIDELLTKRLVVEVVESVCKLQHFVIRDTVYANCAVLGVKLTNRQLELLPQLPEAIVAAEMISVFETINNHDRQR